MKNMRSSRFYFSVSGWYGRRTGEGNKKGRLRDLFWPYSSLFLTVGFWLRPSLSRLTLFGFMPGLFWEFFA